MVGNKNFLVAHYDYLALAVGGLALLAGAAFYVMSMGEDADAAAAEEAAKVERLKPAETGVKGVDMSAYAAAVGVTKSPKLVTDVPEKSESFLASERRVLCKCKKAISGDVKKFPNCPYCGEKQAEEQKIVIDSDADGLPDDWEKKYGLNVNDAADANADKDGDAFTNLEEFQAKTDPTDKNDHPDYLDSIRVVLPLKETKMPFAFRKATKIPSGWRLEFFDPAKKDNYGRKGATITATIGAEIGDSGFTLKAYEPKEAKRERKGMKGMFVAVDVSEATVVRKRDGKTLKLVVDTSKRPKYVPVDVQASLVYERGQVQNLDVVPGQELNLSGTAYKVTDVKPVGKGAAVTFENVKTHKARTLKAEQ